MAGLTLGSGLHVLSQCIAPPFNHVVSHGILESNRPVYLDGGISRPVHEIYDTFNQLFYTLKPEIFDGVADEKKRQFQTHLGNDFTVPRLAAIEFHSHLQKLDKYGKLPDQFVVQSWGVGRGVYDGEFLNSFKRMDEEGFKDYYKRLRYVIGDFSESVLDRAMELPWLQEHLGVIDFVQFDANKDVPRFDDPTLLIQFSELYSTLSNAEQYLVSSSGEIRLLRAKMFVEPVSAIRTLDGKRISAEDFAKNYWPFGIDKLKELHPDFLYEIDVEHNSVPARLDSHPFRDVIRQQAEEIQDGLLPINIGAAKNLSMAMSVLDKYGYLQGFEVGFFEPADMTGNSNIFSWPAYNRGRFMIGNTNVLLNFSFIPRVLSTSDRFSLQTVTDYVFWAMGKRMATVKGIIDSFTNPGKLSFVASSLAGKCRNDQDRESLACLFQLVPRVTELFFREKKDYWLSAETLAGIIVRNKLLPGNQMFIANALAEFIISIGGTDRSFPNFCRMKAWHKELDELEQPTRKVGRNEPCQCGSGKKYKKCHGG